jgi:Stress responsive A/B Barrel Domain
MRTLFWTLFVILVAAIAVFNFQDSHAMDANPQSSAVPTEGKSAPLAHIVFFSLAESTDANRVKLVEACKEYLDKHKGVVFFGVGVNAPEYDREVNDRDYDVALHLVFESAKDHDAYQTHPRHMEFIAECKELWKTVRVFDSTLK